MDTSRIPPTWFFALVMTVGALELARDRQRT